VLRSALAVIVVVVCGANCASSSATTAGPPAAGAGGDEGHGREAAVTGDAQHDGQRREPLPNPRGFAPTRGFQRIDAHVVWDCDMNAVAGESGAILRSVDELAAAIDRTYVGDGAIGSAHCRGAMPTTTDFERYALALVPVEFMASVSYAAERGGTIEIGVTRSAYCGGPAPPSPVIAFVEVPHSAAAITVVGRGVGECIGPPAP
jgi:hypothetical protein